MHDFFAFGGLYFKENEKVHLFELPLSPSSINPERIIPEDEAELMVLLRRYLEGDEDLADGVPVPKTMLIKPILVEVRPSGQCRERFPRLEYFLASAASTLDHLRLNNFGPHQCSYLQTLTSPGFPVQATVGDIQCPALPLIRVQFPPDTPRHPLDTQETFYYHGCLPRYHAFLSQQAYHCFGEQLFRSALAVFEVFILHFLEASNTPPSIPYLAFDWKLYLGKRPFRQVFTAPTPEALYQSLIGRDSDTKMWLNRLPYLVDVHRQLNLFIQQLETFFRSMEVSGLKYFADTIPLNTNLDFDLNPFLDTEEAVYLTAAYDFCLREHFTMLAQEILRILRFEIECPQALGQVRQQIVDKLEDPQWEYSLYDTCDPFFP